MENKFHIIYNSHTENYELKEKDLNLIVGNDVNIVLHFVNEDRLVIDITDFKIFFTVKSDLTIEDTESIPAELQKDVTVHTSPLEGESTIEILNSDTEDLEGNYFYDIKIETDDSPVKIYTVLRGIVNFSKGVTLRKS